MRMEFAKALFSGNFKNSKNPKKTIKKQHFPQIYSEFWR